MIILPEYIHRERPPVIVFLICVTLVVMLKTYKDERRVYVRNMAHDLERPRDILKHILLCVHLLIM